MRTLPIVKMTLYKHGVGFYQRRGAVEGETVQLTFRKDEMNDVLKSLTAFTVGDGQVTGVDYDTPEDKEALLQRSSIQLSDDASLRDLLRDVRGRAVEVKTPTQELAGLAVGVDLPADREPMAATLLSIYLPAEKRVLSLRLGDLLALTLVDARAAADLTYFLETSLTEENKRAVTVRVTPGSADLVVSYIAPSPTWRVSYRLVADEAGDAAKGLLQGWGLFDNTFDEDLENVELTFIAGMPVSFVYDLYTPFTPERPVVQEQARTVAAPVEFDRAMPPAAEMAAPVARGMMTLGAGMPAAPAAMRMARAVSAADLGESTAVAAAGQAQGEFFSYVVANPVTVRRGRSAMSPILQSSLNYRKERIYNGRKQPVNPVITARFKNETGLTLERGPLTVIEDGEYAGEAMVPFTGPGAEVYLAYAVDLGIKVTEEPSSERVLSSVNIFRGMLSVQEYDIQRVKYRVENNNARGATVMIEHPRLNDYTPFETPEPAESTADAYRYPVSADAHAVATFTAQQRRLVARREEIRNQKLAQLQRWLRDKVLDDKTFAALQKILALYDQIADLEAKLKKNEATRQEIFAQQKTIQGNLGSLKESGEEGQLRARYVRTLNQLEDQLAQTKVSDDELRQAIEKTKTEIDAALAAF